MDKREILRTVIEKSVEGFGYEFIGVEWLTGARGLSVRVYIDKPGGILVSDCEKVSRHLTGVLAVESAVSVGLEISSPGLERPLFVPQHYRQFLGHPVKVTLTAPKNEKRVYQGLLSSVSESDITVKTESGDQILSFFEIKKAHLVPQFVNGQGSINRNKRS